MRHSVGNIRAFINSGVHLSELRPLKDINESWVKDGYEMAQIPLEVWYKCCPYLEGEPIYIGKPISFIQNSVFYMDKNYLISLPIFFNSKTDGTLEPTFYATVYSENKDEQSRYLQGIVAGKNAIDKGQYHLVINNNELELEFFSHIAPQLPEDIVYKHFISMYVEAEFGFSSFPKETLEYVFSKKTASYQKRIDEFLKNMPDELTVYRGEGDGSSEDGYSYTLDINVANFFATRYTQGGACIRKGKIKKADVIDYIDSRNESEIICLPEKVYDKEVIQLLDIKDSLVEDIIYDNMDTYHYYRDILNTMDDIRDDSEHGKLHMQRVMIMGLLLKDYMYDSVPFTDTEIEAFHKALIFHDIGRTSEDEDDKHGFDSVKKLNNIFPSDVITNFLIAYHCMDDEVAYDRVKRLSLSKEEQRRVIILYNLLKDADALDRVRFGIRNLDINYLRCPKSLLFTLIAQINYENIE